jgi:hypothetical protein
MPTSKTAGHIRGDLADEAAAFSATDFGSACGSMGLVIEGLRFWTLRQYSAKLSPPEDLPILDLFEIIWCKRHGCT